jgi:hypothetical protein
MRCRLLKEFSSGLMFVALLGCSSQWPTAEVSGKITYNGEPIPVGMITFMAADGSGHADTSSIQDGEYALPRAPIGAVKIQILGSSGSIAGASPANARRRVTSGQRKLAESMGAKLAPKPSESQPKGKSFKLPTRYSNAETSGLSYEVTPGTQTHDIALSP